ncbi:related to GTPase activating protein sec2 [Ustilago trichophora]|uniref:Related to GTPase activating protein sec2 n=1 Tax=Ustilago trichophora TaxID=86804 RepID=A0A5C3DSI0_9BASI|nr:related to GTPase activating protein sec2 [Ustilago trichophora]
MSAVTEPEPEPERSEAGSRTEAIETAAVPESQLQRMDPESILADEANPDEVLGQESSSDAAVKPAAGLQDSRDDEASALKRASAASAIFSHDHSNAHSSPRPESQSLASENNVNPQANASTSLNNMSTEALLAQVKDLTNQVTGLNEKLVKSFNRIADLEDDYSDAQERVRSMSVKIKELEKERSEHLDALNTGLLVEKAHVSSEMQRMMDRVIEETAQRGKAESDKSKIEAELDELSSSLFSEANKMVAVERLSRARAEEKSRNMEERLKDTEGIMLEQQKVLADLQRQVEKLQSGSASKQNGDDGASIITVESEVVSFHRLKTSSLARSISQRTAMQERRHKPAVDLAAEARLIINIVPYQEFRSFIAHLRKLRKQLAPFYNYPLTHAGARDSHSGTPTPRTASPAPQHSTAASTNSITTAASAYSQGFGGTYASSSPFAIAGVSRHRDYPTLPSNVENMVSLPNQLSLPFIKRSQEEDVEPCLRLDFAPGLNWLSRRQTNTAILDGNLVIEPIFSGSATIDEDLIRRENAHLPPAACAMCGIPVVNVPLPGGVAATALSAEQGGKTSLVPSSIATATSSWASSAASSLGSITGSSSGSNSGTITPKPSRGGLFSSFRRSSSSNKPAEAESASNNPSSASPDVEAQAVVSPEGLVLTHLPVPTHIFRLSESAPTRYLLCPHHCLLRLRAACQYWGFVRNLERSVVLEGKFMNEELQHGAAASSSSLDLSKVATSAPQSEQVQTLEKAVAAAEEAPETKAEEAKLAEAAEATEAEKAEAEKEEGEKTEAEKTDDEKTEAEKIKESVQEELDDSDKAVEPQAAEQTEEAKKEAETTEEESSEAEKKTAGDDDDFADAPSSPTEAKTADKDKEAEDGEEAKEAETAEVPAAELSADASAVEKEPTTEAAAETKPSDADTAAATGAAAPPLPPRSVARGTGASSPAPAIPPRRHPRAGAIAAAESTSSSAPVAPPSRTPTPLPTALYLDKLESMEWEDKMWTEVTKLKEELWRARIGLITEDGA